MNIYEWLYQHYYAPCAKDVTASYTEFADLAQEARRLLLSGEEIGRASWRERVYSGVEFAGGGGGW